jgi:hypothetical protein
MRWLAVIVLALSLGCTTIDNGDHKLMGWGKSAASVTTVTGPNGTVTVTERVESAGLTENAVAIFMSIPGAILRGVGTIGKALP